MENDQHYEVLFEGVKSLGGIALHLFHSRPRDASRGRILFLGGSNFDLRIKGSFRQASLLHQFEFVTYEPRGLARSSLPPGDWSMADYASDAAKVINALGWSHCVVIGDSFGGMTALHLAINQPEKVAALVVSSATAGGEGGSSIDLLPLLELESDAFSRQMLLQQDSRNRSLERHDAQGFKRKLQQRITEDRRFLAVSGASGGYRRLLQARKRHDVWQRLSEVRIPVLVLAGRYDQQAPLEAQRNLASALPNAQLTVFEGGHGHLFAGEAAQQTILAWLDVLALSR